MRTCIWCLKNESTVPFNKLAHTFPQSLGGEYICEAVCDDCNLFFGSRTSRYPSVEVVLKEILQISQVVLLTYSKEHIKKRFKSTYFKFDQNKFEIKIKGEYRFTPKFQTMAARQFKKGIYKVYLEERQRILGDSLDGRFNFIREYCRFDLGEIPLFVIPTPSVFFSSSDIKSPQFRFTEASQDDDAYYRMYSYFVMGHYFVMVTSPAYELTFEKYKSKVRLESSALLGAELKEIKEIGDLNFTMQLK